MSVSKVVDIKNSDELFYAFIEGVSAEEQKDADGFCSRKEPFYEDFREEIYSHQDDKRELEEDNEYGIEGVVRYYTEAEPINNIKSAVKELFSLYLLKMKQPLYGKAYYFWNTLLKFYDEKVGVICFDDEQIKAEVDYLNGEGKAYNDKEEYFSSKRTVFVEPVLITREMKNLINHENELQLLIELDILEKIPSPKNLVGVHAYVIKLDVLLDKALSRELIETFFFAQDVYDKGRRGNIDKSSKRNIRLLGSFVQNKQTLKNRLIRNGHTVNNSITEDIDTFIIGLTSLDREDQRNQLMHNLCLVHNFYEKNKDLCVIFEKSTDILEELCAKKLEPIM